MRLPIRLQFMIPLPVVAVASLVEIETELGRQDWRKDLIEELAQSQRPDGSWINKNRQWFENDPNLCTAFALMALSYCQERLDDKPRQSMP